MLWICLGHRNIIRSSQCATTLIGGSHKTLVESLARCKDGQTSYRPFQNSDSGIAKAVSSLKIPMQHFTSVGLVPLLAAGPDDLYSIFRVYVLAQASTLGSGLTGLCLVCLRGRASAQSAIGRVSCGARPCPEYCQVDCVRHGNWSRTLSRSKRILRFVLYWSACTPFSNAPSKS